MTRRKPFRYDDDENLFDSFPEIEEEFPDEDDDSHPFYEDPDELDKLIEEELGTPTRRKRTRKLT